VVGRVWCFAPHSALISTKYYQCHFDRKHKRSPARAGLKGEISSFATLTFTLGQEFWNYKFNDVQSGNTISA
jgi:hypothetical protein